MNIRVNESWSTHAQMNEASRLKRSLRVSAINEAQNETNEQRKRIDRRDAG
jgi:hypothetical protein